MAIDYISFKDSSGNIVKMAVDTDGSGINWQVLKMAFGTLDAGFTAVDAANPLPVIGSHVHAEDSASVDADKGSAILAVRRDSPSAAVSTDGDYAFLSVDSTGGLRTTSYPRLRSVSAPTMTRPATTPTYGANYAVSNNATAGSVTPLLFAMADANDAALMLIQATLSCSDTGLSGHNLRLYLYNQLPIVDAGDNALWTQTRAHGVGLIGTMITAATTTFSDGCQMFFTPESGSFIPCPPSSGGVNIWGLLQTTDGFTAHASSTFDFSIQAQQAR